MLCCSLRVIQFLAQRQRCLRHFASDSKQILVVNINIFFLRVQADQCVLTILMYTTTVYTLVNGRTTHQKQQISEKGDITQHDIAKVM